MRGPRAVGDHRHACPRAGGCGAVCGNGIIEAGEGCDDGNSAWFDGCDPTCQVQPQVETDCGDGIEEDCDGNIDCFDSDCAGAPSCP